MKHWYPYQIPLVIYDFNPQWSLSVIMLIITSDKLLEALSSCFLNGAVVLMITSDISSKTLWRTLNSPKSLIRYSLIPSKVLSCHVNDYLWQLSLKMVFFLQNFHGLANVTSFQIPHGVYNSLPNDSILYGLSRCHVNDYLWQLFLDFLRSLRECKFSNKNLMEFSFPVKSSIITLMITSNNS